MVLTIRSTIRSGIRGIIGALLAFVIATWTGLFMADPAGAFLFSTDNPDICTNTGPNGAAAIPCVWSFETIASVKSTVVTGVTEGSANLGRLGRVGFATSDLTVDQIGEDHTNSEASMLSWDRQIGIARDLSTRIGIKIDVAKLRSEEFLLLPAAFNAAFLSDFVNFIACGTAHTFIFSGALDGRSDAPHVTERSQASKESVCLDIAGADCKGVEARFEPRRRYFNSDVQCHYGAKVTYTPTYKPVPRRPIWYAPTP